MAQAETRHKKALEIDQVMGNKEGIVSGYANLGTVYGRRGDTAQAETMNRTPLELLDEIGDTVQAKFVRERLDALGVLHTRSSVNNH